MGSPSAHAAGYPELDALTGTHLMASTGGHQVPWFSFIAHLRSRSDLDKWNPKAATDRADGADWRDRVLRGPPVLVSTFGFRSTPVTGDLIVIPRLPEDIIYGEGRKLVARAVQIAVDRGARVVGLGGLTAPATRGGASLLPHLPAGVTLTNGNSFTALVARANVREACAYIGRPSPVVAILGSTGSVGVAASRLLVEDDIDLLLIGRSTQRARKAGPEVADRVRYSSELSDVALADVVLVLTGDSSARLTPAHFDDKRERIVVDVAQPSNIAINQRPAFRRSRVQVVRGGWVQMLGAVSSKDHAAVMTEGEPHAPRGSAPACLAETCLFAVDAIREHAVGPASAELARTLERIAARRGVQMCPLSLQPRPSGGIDTGTANG
jgi:fatty aldehyde-generating acyl-ACP reductase